MMRYLLSVVLLCITFNAQSTDYYVEYQKVSTTMSWHGASHADYQFKLYTVAIVAQHESGFGLRVGYGQGDETYPDEGAFDPSLSIDLKESVELELLYTHRLVDKIDWFVGAGYYWHKLPIYEAGDLIKADEDNDKGFVVGINYNVSKKLSFQFQYRHYSSIAPNKDKGSGGSDHTGIGFSIRWRF